MIFGAPIYVKDNGNNYDLYVRDALCSNCNENIDIQKKYCAFDDDFKFSDRKKKEYKFCPYCGHKFVLQYKDNDISEESDDMNIYALKGHKVIVKTPGKYSEDREKFTKLNMIGKTFTVDGTLVHNSSTDVYLKEFPGIKFNSCSFKDLIKQPKEKDKLHPQWAQYNG